MAEGGGLLNRYTVQSRIKGSNPFLSATLRPFGASGGRPSGTLSGAEEILLKQLRSSGPEI